MYDNSSELLGTEQLARDVAGKALSLLRPFLIELDRQLDRRLVGTLANTVFAVIRHRNRPLGLLLSELGSFLIDPQHAPAGTKRLGNLLHSDHWQANIIDDYLLERAGKRVQEAAGRVAEGRALCILDGSVLEKPESVVLEGLSPVISSKARRLSRPRPKLGKGYYRGKPGGPIVVPGYHWIGILVSSWAPQVEHSPLTVGAWHWYAKPRNVPEGENVVPEQRPGAQPEDLPRQRQQEAVREVLERAVGAWGKDRLLHVWDRGMSGAPWLSEVLDKGWCFAVRWKKGNRLRPLAR